MNRRKKGFVSLFALSQGQGHSCVTTTSGKHTRFFLVCCLSAFVLPLIAQTPATSGSPTPVPTPSIPSNVVRKAPSLEWIDFAGRKQTFAAFPDRPVVLIITPADTDKNFISQIKRLANISERLQSANTVFMVAFTETPGRVPSDIPFITVLHGARVGAEYASQGAFRIAVMGRDGNLDCVSTKPLPGQRILDIINNSFTMQSYMRRK